MTNVLWEVYVWEGPVAADGYGQLLAQVPAWQGLSFSPLANAVGAGQISLPLDCTIFWNMGNTPETTPILATETLWQVVQTNLSAGTQPVEVFSFLAQSVDRTTVESDETRTVTVSGPGTAQCLNWGMAMPFGWQPTAGGFIGVTGAIQDSFDEQDAAGTFEIDTALWNLATPGACSIPASTATYTQATAPTGTIQTDAVWYDTATKPVTQYIWDGNYWVNSSDYSASTGGGSVQVNLTPSGAYLGGGEFTWTNSSFSASVSPATPNNASAPGCPLDNDPCNGSDVTQLIIRPSSGGGYAMISLSYAEFYCQYQDKDGNLSNFNMGTGRAGGTGAYDQSWAQYWRISCDLQTGGYLIRFWTSGDGAAWTLQYSLVAPTATAWDPSLVNVFMGGEYNTTGANGAYAQFSSLNGEIQANPDNGPIYISTPAMAIMADQLARVRARGTAPFITPTFTATTDSDGNTWADTWSVQVPVGTDMLSAQTNYAGAVDAQWYMQPGYQLYTGLNPGRQLQDSIIFHEGEMAQYGRTQTRDQIYNVAAATDGSGMIWTETSSASIAEWGQRETFTLSGGTIDAQSAVNTAQAAVEQWDDEVDARVIQVPPNADGKTAFVDFTIFDWIGVERSDFSAADAMQVIGITISVDQDGAETHEVVVNTYRQVMAQWFAYLLNKFGGQAASTLGALTPGTTAGSAFTLAVGPNLAVSPAQTGGSGSSKASGLSTISSIAQSPEVTQATSYSTQPASVGSGVPVTGQSTGIIPGSMLQTGSVPEEALSFTLPSGSKVTFSSTAPAGPSTGDLWYNTSSGNSLSQWSGSSWQPYTFGASALSATAAQLGGVQTYVQSTAPTGSINAGSQWYDTAAGNALYVYTSGSWVLNPFGAGAVNFTALSIGGVNVYLQSTAPTGSINTGSLWYDSSNNYLLNIYNGSAWTAYAFGTNAIASGTITTALLAASAVTAAKIAAGAITATQLAAGSVTATQLAAGSVTAASIAAGTITTTQIAAGTITALDLISGIIIAGAVDGTTVTGATMIADGSSGQFLIYSGTPEAGNLIGSWSGYAGTDGFGNPYPAGLSVQQGNITGLDIDSTTLTNSTFQGGTALDTEIDNPQVTGGTITETEITFDTTGGILLVYTSTTTTTTITAAGTSNFTVPSTVTQGKIETWAAGEGGDGGKTTGGGNGGTGGSYACEPEYGLTPGAVVTVVNGTAGTGGVTGSSSHGANGGDTLFDGVQGVHAIGGGNTGYGPFNSVSHAGGAGGATPSSTGGSSGGNSGGPTVSGNAGIKATTSSGASSPSSQTGTGQGAPGGNSGSNANTAGGSPGAGGGGAGEGTANNVTNTYSPTWVGSYYGPDASSGANNLRSSSTLYQGQSSRGGGATSGNQRAIMRFNASQIHSDFAGTTGYQSFLNISNENTAYDAGMIVEVSYCNSLLGGTQLGSYPTGDTTTHVVDWFVPAGGSVSIPLGATCTDAFGGDTIDSIIIGADVAADYAGVEDWQGYFSSAVTLTVQATPSTSAKDGSAGGTGKVAITYTSGQALAAAISPEAGTDEYGNAYVAGISAQNLQIFGTTNPATLSVPTGSAVLYGTTNGTPSYKMDSGFFGQIPATQCDVGSHTNTGTGYAALTAAWAIPANDANVGTCYRVKCWGIATSPSTTQSLGFEPMVFGGSGSIPQVFGPLTTSQQWTWEAEINVIIVTTGASGTAIYTVRATLSETGDNGGEAGGARVVTSVVSVNTTAATTIAIYGTWDGGTGRTVTGLASTFERIGS